MFQIWRARGEAGYGAARGPPRDVLKGLKPSVSFGYKFFVWIEVEYIASYQDTFAFPGLSLSSKLCWILLAY